MRNRRAMTLIELLVSLLILGLVMGAAMKFFVGQSTTFRRGSSDFNMLQNERAGTDLLRQHLRSVGANVVAGQPAVIYASSDILSFNADYATHTKGDLAAIYYTPSAPDAEVSAIRVANAIPVPGQTAVTYPTFDYQVALGVMSPAEMITFWFAPDTETARTDDYVLFRQVNNSTPEAVIRNVLQDTVPFFRYLYSKDSAGAQTLDTLKAAKLPAVWADSAATTTLGNFRAVIVSFVITNGLAASAERKHPVTLVAPFPNLASRQLMTCGNNPLPMQAPTIATGPDGTSIDITWSADPDETGGERDIMNYALWRRQTGDSVWNAPLVNIPAGNPPTYHYHDANVSSDTVFSTTWEYAVAAVDCTPSFSDPIVSTSSITLPPAVP